MMYNMISNKNQAKFLGTMASLYRKAAKIRNGGEKIVRGRKRCISGKFEDEFAKLILHCIVGKSKCYRIFVDYPITIPRIRSRNKSIYIDFMLCKESNKEMDMIYMAEMKLDTGWMRNNVYKVAKKLDTLLVKLRNTKDVSSKDQDCFCEGDRIYFKFSNETLYDLIILSSANNGYDVIERACELARKRLITRIFVLTDQSVNKNTSDLCPCRDFSELEKRIRNCIKSF